MPLKKTLPTFAALILIAAAVLSALAHSLGALGASARQRRQGVMLAARALGEASPFLLQPIHTVQAMANDGFLAAALRSGQDGAERIPAYLARMAGAFGYEGAFVVSDETRRLYTEGGAGGVVDPGADADDMWYVQFLSSGAPVALSVRAAEGGWLLRVHARIEDGGALLGVAGVEARLDGVLGLLARYKAEYGADAAFTDGTGLVVLSPGEGQMNAASLAYLVLPAKQSSEYRYVRFGIPGFAVTRYCAEFGWYFVLRAPRADVHGARVPPALFYVLEVLILAAALGALSLAAQKLQAKRTGFGNRNDKTDALTGLPNRNFFKEMYGERGVFNTTSFRCLAVFDIDFFKEANDSMNGDDALISVVENAKHLLGGRGMILRWGGDEFLMLMEVPMESAFAICRQFVRNVEADGLVTVSVGLTEVRISDTIKKNYYRAAQCCYQVKEMGGNGVKKG